ncbi:hypothetical protein PIB30_023365 [Stylosanthes scabra]|uniref:Uncharacterized protein n=1 Tax=Stylosanthes scabra TaxID=79078 RepID=A0ABU6UC97_9FABA|nr:hypothetical protein [Stylosanthes scabra]
MGTCSRSRNKSEKRDSTELSSAVHGGGSALRAAAPSRISFSPRLKPSNSTMACEICGALALSGG